MNNINYNESHINCIGSDVKAGNIASLLNKNVALNNDSSVSFSVFNPRIKISASDKASTLSSTRNRFYVLNDLEVSNKVTCASPSNNLDVDVHTKIRPSVSEGQNHKYEKMLTSLRPSVSDGQNLDENILTTMRPSGSGGHNHDYSNLTTIRPSGSGGHLNLNPIDQTNLWDCVSLNRDSLFKENSERHMKKVKMLILLVISGTSPH